MQCEIVAPLLVLIEIAADNPGNQPIFELSFEKIDTKIPSQLSIPAIRRYVSGKIEVLTASRQIYTHYSFAAGNLPWTYFRENVSYVIPDEREMAQILEKKLIKIGYSGQCCRTAANEYYQNPFKTENWVSSSRIDKSREASSLFYHNLKMSWVAFFATNNHIAHLRGGLGTRPKMYFIDSNGMALQSPIRNQCNACFTMTMHV